MQTLRDGMNSLSLIARLNLDNLIFPAALGLALFGASFMMSL